MEAVSTAKEGRMFVVKGCAFKKRIFAGWTSSTVKDTWWYEWKKLSIAQIYGV